MKTSLSLGALVLLGASLCLADSWNGKLVDSACPDRQSGGSPQSGQQSSCSPTRSTTTFGIQTQDGRILRLDSTGNAKAAEMMRTPHSGSGDVRVTISGTQDGRVLRVDTIEIQQ